jgi:hypothetical protein
MRLHAVSYGLCAAVILFVLPCGSAQARVDCHPNCDFVHDYGPYNLSWARPGLWCAPRCDARGNCAPTPSCFVATGVAGQNPFETSFYGRRPIGRVTVRPRRSPPR